MMNGFKGSAARLNDFDIAQVAGTMEVEVAALRAVLTVESAGAGFDAATSILHKLLVLWK